MMAPSKDAQAKPRCPEGWSCTVCTSSELTVYRVFKYMAEHLDDEEFTTRWAHLNELWLDTA